VDQVYSSPDAVADKLSFGLMGQAARFPLSTPEKLGM
jgi:hypothetical protein